MKKVGVGGGMEVRASIRYERKKKEEEKKEIIPKSG